MENSAAGGVQFTLACIWLLWFIGCKGPPQLHPALLNALRPPLSLPQAKVAPFATKAQLYTVLADRTAVDRQLDELRRSNAVRVMQVSQRAAERRSARF